MLYGIYGDGDLSVEAVTEHLGRLADAAQVDEGEVWFAVHIPEEPGKGLLNVIQWLNESEAWWIGFSSTDAGADSEEYEGSQEEPVVVKNIGRKFVSLFKKESDDTPVLLALYTDGGDTDEMMEVLETVIAGGFAINDLSDGLTPIELTDDPAEDVKADDDKDDGPRYSREELEALELRELRSLALAEGKPWSTLHHTQSTKMKKAALIEYFLGEGEAPEAEKAAEEPVEATPRRRGRPAKEEPAEDHVAPDFGKVLSPDALGVREILVKHLSALLEELKG